ncbi:amidohydrolase family protein [Maribacter luteus]|uniref:Amidohydrolase family protein n=1 Tax=Maribacter luteus TaxID=2594478 RepID=A0A6I2MTJ8_9FLAO|nr:amidohydrolase family protein [Maribacter luteus]MRX66319.1 amidohydrolase family protein [Maribacter luteus]
MKKWLKRVGILLLGLTILMVVAISVILILDKKNTSYLKIGKTTDSYVIKNVNVVPMTRDTVLYKQDILVEKGLISKIAPNLVTDSMVQIDGSGKYLVPGLADLHVHVWDDYELGLYLAKGVTTVRNMWGMPFHLRMKKRVVNNEIFAPLFFTASPKITGPEDHGIDKKQVADANEGRGLVGKYKEQGYDYIKTYAGLPKDIFDAIKEEAIRQDISIAAHPSFEVPYSYHFSRPIKTIEHTEDVIQQALKFKNDSVLLTKTIESYVQGKMGHTPTLTVFHKISEIMEKETDLFKEPTLGYINPAFLEVGSQDDFNRWTSTKSYDSLVEERIMNQHKQHLKIVKQMNDAGVILVAGTDSGISYAIPGFGIHEELGYYVEAGLTNYEALRTATVNPSKIYLSLSNTGTLEVGKMANMVLTNENPLIHLKTLANPEKVFIKGYLLDADKLLQFKEKAYKRNNYLATLVRMGEGLWLQ